MSKDLLTHILFLLPLETISMLCSKMLYRKNFQKTRKNKIMHKSPTYSKIVSCSKICKRNCHHKQDFSFRFLLQIQIVKSYNFCLKSACVYEFQTLPHPTIFLTACIRSKESISIPAVMQENLVPISALSFH